MPQRLSFFPDQNRSPLSPLKTAHYSRPLYLFAVFTAFCTLCLIGVGGLVTSHGVGMAVPDWPNTYGYNMFAFPVSQWVGGIFYEHTHRLVGSFVGLLTTILAIWLWARETSGRVRWMGVSVFIGVVLLLGVRQMPVYIALAALSVLAMILGMIQARRTGWPLRWLGAIAFAAVVLQGVLGGLRVVWAQDQIGIFHATLAQVFFLLVGVIALRTSRMWLQNGSVVPGSFADAKLHWLLVVTTTFILGQLVLGATMRHQHAGLAIPDFPLAYGSVWPDTSVEAVLRYNQQRVETVALNPITATQMQLQMLHRLMALGIVCLVTWAVWRLWKHTPQGHVLRRFAGVWMLLIMVQFGLGVWTVLSDKAADVASLHVIVGAISLMTGGLMCVISARSMTPLCDRDSAGKAGSETPCVASIPNEPVIAR